MEINRWKTVILKWVNSTGFLDRQFYSLEQTDLDSFFKLFKQRTFTPSVDLELMQFLKDEYSDFDVRLDDDNDICGDEYLFIYTLLLHYSCVKKPCEYFHKLCNGMDARHQVMIASFFKSLMDVKMYTRDDLRKAIYNIGPGSPFSPVNFNRDSPVRSSNGAFSPSTPKSHMLAEKTRELITLRAQLETERYEKGYLESQIKTQEHQVTCLHAEQKRLQSEVQELKNEILIRDTENISPNQNPAVNDIKRRLRKELNEKDDLIIKLKSAIDNLSDEKKILYDKLNYTENEIKLLSAKSQQLDASLDDVKFDNERKSEIIKHLQTANEELQTYLQEKRNSKTLMDTSIECLDSSSGNVNSSNDISIGPESLAKSVIDLQLQEKRSENESLKSSLENLMEEKELLKQSLTNLCSSKAESLGINFDAIESDADLQKTYEAFVQFFNNLVDDFQCTQSRASDINNLYKTTEEKNKSLTNSLEAVKDALHKSEECNEALENDLKKLQTNFTELKSSHDELLQQEISFKRKIDEVENKLMSETAMNTKINLQNSTLLMEVKESSEHNRKLANELSNLQQSYNDLETKFNKLGEMHLALEKDNVNLTELGNQTKMELQKAHNKQSELNQTYSELKSQFESKEKELTEVTEQLQSSLIIQRQQQVDLETVKQQLEKTLKDNEELLNEFGLKESCLTEQINEYTGKIRDLQTELEKRDDIVKNSSSQLSNVTSKLALNSEKLEELSTTITNLESDKQRLLDDNMEKLANLQELDANVKQLLFQKEILTMENEQSKSEIQRLFVSVSELNVEKAKLSTDCGNFLRKIEAYELNINQLNEDNAIFKKMQRESDEKIATLLIEIADLKKKEHDYLTNVDNLTTENSNLLSTRERLEIESDTMTNLVSELKATILELKKSKEKLEIQKSEVDNVLHELKAKLSHIDAKKTDLEQKNSNLIEELLVLEKTSQDTKQQLDLLFVKNKEILVENDKLSKTIKLLQGQVTELEELKNAMESEKLGLRTKTEELILDNMKIENELADMKNKIQHLLTSESSLRVTNANYSSEIDKLAKKLNDAEKEKSILSTELSIQRDTLLTQEIEMSQLNKELMDKRSWATEVNIEMMSLKETISKLNGEVNRRQHGIEALTETNIMFEQKLIDAEMTVKSAMEERTQLKSMIDTLESNLLKTSKINDEYCDQLNKKLEYTESRIALLEKEKSELLDKYESIGRDLNDAKDSINHLSLVLNESEKQLEEEKLNNLELNNQLSDLKVALETEHKTRENFAELQQECNEYIKRDADNVKKLAELEKSGEELRKRIKALLDQIESLNTEIEQCKAEQKTVQLLNEDLDNSIKSFKARNVELTEKNEKLIIDKMNLNKSLLDLTKSSEELVTSAESTKIEIRSRLAELDKIAKEQLAINEQHRLKEEERSRQLEMEIKELRENNSLIINELRAKEKEILELRMQMHKQMEECASLKNIKMESDKGVSTTSVISDDQKLCAKLKEDSAILRAKLMKQREMLQEKELKWDEEKRRLEALATQATNTDTRIREVRNEYEGKLEKMKAKMKKLCSEELEKNKVKYEKTIIDLGEENKIFLDKCEQYKRHAEKLSNQIYQLNEKDLELRKENEHLKAKLIIIERSQTSGLPSQRHVNQIQSKIPMASSKINLHMEDEEGEQFNNAYLTDLLVGKCAKKDVINQSDLQAVSPSELLYRNSLAPPHLRCAYAAQYGDHDIREDFLKDGLMDGSLSSLLPAGSRRKQGGTTSYKKPGPPTPSKNAGRLSLGSVSDTSHRDNLKEYRQETPRTNKTPGRFRNIFSSSKIKDEWTNDCNVISSSTLDLVNIKDERLSSESKESSNNLLALVEYNSHENAWYDMNDEINDEIPSNQILKLRSSIATKRKRCNRLSLASSNKVARNNLQKKFKRKRISQIDKNRRLSQIVIDENSSDNSVSCQSQSTNKEFINESSDKFEELLRYKKSVIPFNDQNDPDRISYNNFKRSKQLKIRNTNKTRKSISRVFSSSIMVVSKNPQCSRSLSIKPNITIKKPSNILKTSFNYMHDFIKNINNRSFRPTAITFIFIMFIIILIKYIRLIVD